ncbi:DUF4153 domain-containing protein [Streptomyces sp. PpalLS-921]|uniref:DUF4153 domain-containing protein n=1 Tax=Streptomyces sp. PpalLS-921 TaxID=1839772 RepID=UPI000B83649F|nr:DUF4153 domain-containing protein [Streptomyces sp. PpalLS-921]
MSDHASEAASGRPGAPGTPPETGEAEPSRSRAVAGAGRAEGPEAARDAGQPAASARSRSGAPAQGSGSGEGPGPAEGSGSAQGPGPGPAQSSVPARREGIPGNDDPSGATGPSGEAGSDGPGGAHDGRTGPDVSTAPAHRKAPPPPAASRQRRAQQPPPGLLTRLRPPGPPPITAATLCSALAAGLLSALLLGDGLGLNLLFVAVAAALAAYFAARAAGRRLRPWTAVWAVGGLALLAVPALRDAGWPSFLALVSALALGSLALHGSRGWPGVLFGSWGLCASVSRGVRWGWRGVRDRADDSRGRVRTAARTTGVAVVLLVVFGALFASADPAFADLLSGLTPDLGIGDSPWRAVLFVLGLFGALAAAHTAAAPVRWDGMTVRPGPARKRAEWAVPLIVLDLLFALFVGFQLVVLLGGYDKVLEETGLTRSAYARQGFWQLLWATVLTLVVIALARRWAPRGGRHDRTLVRSVLGVLCVLTLVVVASALRRMDLYVEAFGLTRLRISVAAVELWLGVVLVLILVAGVFGARLLPRAVAVSAAACVLAFGLVSPDGLIAEQNVHRYQERKAIDIDYLRELSADAVPALDTLPEPLRSCALERIQRKLATSDAPWYATSWGEARARDVLAANPAEPHGTECYSLGRSVDEQADERGIHEEGGYPREDHGSEDPSASY